MIYHSDPQGTEAWHEARRGVITASRAADARNRTNGLTKQQNAYVAAILARHAESAALALAGYKKKPASEDIEKAINGVLPLKWGDSAIRYAQDMARERVGGKCPILGGAMATRIGHEEEPFGAIAYIARTGCAVEEVGFATTDDRKFGMSLDRRVPAHKGALEIKTMVGSETLFKAVVDGDIGDYRDQCVFGLWLFVLDWIDLCLWCPDLQHLEVIRIGRDEAEIQALEDDLLAFDALVGEYEAKLRAKLTGARTATEPPPWEAPSVAAPITPAAPAPKAPAPMPEFNF